MINNNLNKPQNKNQPSFNMEYVQKELNNTKPKTNNNSIYTLDLGSNSTRKVKDPFSNLVNFN
jgi:hypothetical protein